MRLLKFAIAVIIAYLLFKAPGALLGSPIPASLLSLYMLFAIITILLVMTITDEGVEGLVRPVERLVADPALRTVRNAVFVALPLVLATATFISMGKGQDAPMEYRTVHPAPPASITAYGKTFELGTLENPFRALEHDDPGAFGEIVREGGEVYFKNCFFCHGAKLDGAGHYALALNPRPLSFQGTDTIAQLKESYLFWRVVKGGVGLPREAQPWASAMPAWEDILTEGEVWKVISFLYDYTGVRPRTWAGGDEVGEKMAEEEPDGSVGIEAVYMKRCSWCHGEDGAGDGPAAPYLNPPPRDLTFGDYKWRSTPFDEPSPTDADLFGTIAGKKSDKAAGGWTGLDGTSMPGWGDLLTMEEIAGLVGYLRELAMLDPPRAREVDTSGRVSPANLPANLDDGRRLYEDRCSECHGELGMGDARKRLKGDMGERTWPRNLTKPWTFRGGAAVKDIYKRIAVGVAGTQMPSFFDPASKKRLSSDQAWRVAEYVASLGTEYKKPAPANVIRAALVPGPLPEGPSDPAWDGAGLASLPLFPQIFLKERHFTPSVDSVTIRALYNNREIALLMEWDDPTKSIPGNKKAEEIAGGEVFQDAVAVEFPKEFVPGGSRPYFGMGGMGGTGGAQDPVSIWRWKSAPGDDLPGTLSLLESRGTNNIKKLDDAGLTGKGRYEKGTWKVLLKRPLRPEGAREDIAFSPGVYTPVAFAAWDGSNGERGGRHVMTTWCWLVLDPGEGFLRYVLSLVVFFFVIGLEVSWALSARTYRP
jgi:DMSO reductase family type II enzyme heme b subunit